MDNHTHSETPFTLGEKGLAIENIFSLPEGYFYELMEKIVARIAVETFESSAITDRLNTYSEPSLPGTEINLEGGFKIPSETYFDSLSDRIFSKIERQEAEAEFLDPLLHEALRRTQFFLPDAYFDTFSTRILEEIENPDLILQKFNLEKTVPFTVPEDYFSKISINLDQKIENLTLLPQINKSFEGIILNPEPTPVQQNPNLKNNPSGPKIISLVKKRNFQWFAAACITLLAIFSGIQIRQTYLDKVAYPILGQDDRLKYRFGIDESVIEDELVSDGINELPSKTKESMNPINTLNDQYLLSHPDTHTLLEEL